MISVNLEVVAERSLKSAIHWATTNKGYSDMKEDFIYLVDVIVDNSRYPRHTKFYQMIKQRVVDSTVRKAAPSLTKAQQRKLRTVLDLMTTPPLKLMNKDNNKTSNSK